MLDLLISLCYREMGMATTKKKTKTTARKGKEKVSKSSVAKVKRKQAFRTYERAMKYLFGVTDYEKQHRLRYNSDTFDLGRMERFLKALGDPHLKTEMVHIVGTKGKGSTATMLTKMLEANDYSVGLYTSPHVTSLHERIVVDSKMITQKEIHSLINRVHPTIKKMADKDDGPTFFEIMTVLAFLHFFDKGVDVAVIEAGLGGRLDSTNVIQPALVGITSISIDHQNLLGDDLASITTEKAGVMKEGVPVITVQQDSSAMCVLRRFASKVGAPLSVTGREIEFSYRFESSREEGPHTRVCVTTANSRFEHLRVPLQGEHQAINCGLALAMIDQLKVQGYKIDDNKAIAGLKKTSLIGRMEIICRDPQIIIDAAHNAASIRALIQAIGQHIPCDSMVVIFGCNSDKDVRGMLQQLQFGADKVIFTRNNSPKAVSPHDLAEMYTEMCGKMCQTAMTLHEAIRTARSALTKEDLICITGSFYLVGQAKELSKTGALL